MKVFTATLYTNNYGSVLQAYALQQKLKELGAEPVVIKKPSPIGKGAPQKMSLKTRIKHFFKPEKHYGLGRKLRRFFERRIYKEKKRKLNSFVSSNIIAEELDSCINKMQTERCLLLAGSDQIWNTLNHDVDSFYYFDYAKNSLAKKASYAASIGVCSLSEDKKGYYRDILKEFDVVSFREEIACELLKDHLKNPQVRCDIDPTLLHKRPFWDKLAGERVHKRPYVFVYMLRPDKKLITLARKAAKKYGCDIVYMGLFVNHYAGVKTVSSAGVEEFLSYIKYAEAVITNSFHGTVFSLIFEKRFASVKIESTSSRVENLLGILNLNDHLISDSSQLDSALQSCDYMRAQQLLEEKISESTRYLCRLIEAE